MKANPHGLKFRKSVQIRKCNRVNNRNHHTTVTPLLSVLPVHTRSSWTIEKLKFPYLPEKTCFSSYNSISISSINNGTQFVTIIEYTCTSNVGTQNRNIGKLTGMFYASTKPVLANLSGMNLEQLLAVSEGLLAAREVRHSKEIDRPDSLTSSVAGLKA